MKVAKALPNALIHFNYSTFSKNMDYFDYSASIILHENVATTLNTDVMFLELFRRHNYINIFVNYFSIYKCNICRYYKIKYKIIFKDNYAFYLYHS